MKGQIIETNVVKNLINVMNKEELSFLINTTLSKGWNIIYYRTIDDRPRATYIHVVREFRKQLLNVVAFLSDDPEYKRVKDLMLDLIRAINPKVKTDECMGTIIEMDKIYKSYYEQ